MTVSEYLDAVEPDFDPAVSLLRSKWSSAGYHSTREPGSTVHPLRDSLSYAAYLLKHGTDDSIKRAHEVASAVLVYQDSDPTSRTFGVWPYLAEEPLDTMNPPDWNWADFLGSTIGLICFEFGVHIESTLLSKLHAAIERAAHAIFRRNIGPDYTNIAIMGAGVCLMAGEIVNDQLLHDYGRTRLSNIDQHRRRNGDFAEYNSPTYTFVAIEELARILYVVRDEVAKKTAEALYHHGWKVAADHFHPPTAQLAGPHSRAYSERLLARTAAMIEAGTGHRIPSPEAGNLEQGRTFGPLPPPLFDWRPCPPEVRDGFAQEYTPGGTIRTPFIRGVVPPVSVESAPATSGGALAVEPSGGAAAGVPAQKRDDIAGTTWFGESACLGSVTADSSWVQRHGLIAYWRRAEDIASCFRPRVLKDGRDFASFMLRTAQEGPQLLCGFSPLTNGGDWHLYLDHPPDHTFSFSDLRIRFQVSSPASVAVDRVSEDRYILSADGVTVEIQPLGGAFRGSPVRWETGGENGFGWVDAVLHAETEVSVDFSTLTDTWLGAAVDVCELAGTGDGVGASEAGHGGTPQLSVQRRTRAVTIRRSNPPLEVTLPTFSEKYPLDPSIWKQG